MLQTLKEYVGDMSRSLSAVVDSLESTFGRMFRVGGPDRVYDVDGEYGAIYTVGTNGSAMGLAWKQNQIVDTLYWWDTFDFGNPDYAIDLPQGIDIERIIPAIQHAIKTKHLGEIVVS